MTAESSTPRPDAAAPPRAVWDSASFEERCNLIIDTALRLLHAEGLKGMTMRAVAQGLGVGAMTLYTYVSGQEQLRSLITKRGFDMLNESCNLASTLGTPEGWRGGAWAYLHFATDNPNLYELMFTTPIERRDSYVEMFEQAFDRFVERVRAQVRMQPIPESEVDHRARRYAETYWVALHGLASLAIAGRLGSDQDRLLEDLVERVAPPHTVTDGE